MRQKAITNFYNIFVLIINVLIECITNFLMHKNLFSHFRGKKFCVFLQPRTKKQDKMNNKKLYRSMADKKLCGVCGGLGEYFEVDPTLIRLLWVIFTFMGGAGLLAYIICAIIVPQQNQLPEP